MKKTLLLFLAAGLIADSFITRDEYAKMLYQNPRGIGCHKCHGIDGRGRLLGSYHTDNNETKTILAPDITKLGYKRFYKALTTGKHRLMPHYFLTDHEIKTLYYYLVKKRAQ